jgi:hypothetical protein
MLGELLLMAELSRRIIRLPRKSAMNLFLGVGSSWTALARNGGSSLR